jgi:integrase
MCVPGSRSGHVLDASTIDAAEEREQRVSLEALIARRRFQTGHLSVVGKKPKRYVVRYYERTLKHDGTLGRTRKAVTLGPVNEIGNRQQAKILADGILRRVNLAQPRLQAVISLADFAVNEWMPTVLPSLKHSTTMQYRFILKSHVIPALGQVRLCDLTREHLQAFLGAKTRAGLSWETVAHLRNVLSKLLGSAVEWRYLQENLAKLTKLPRRPPRKPRPFLTGEQVNKLLSELGEPVQTIVLLLVVTGARIGELVALRWKYVDLERGILQIREAVYDGHFGTPKTSSSVADLPLGPEAVRALRHQLERASGSAQPQDLVFPNIKGGPVNPKNLLRRVLYPTCVNVGIPRVSWHALRHTHATLLAAGGASPKLIQSQLRHATTQLALELYTHQLPGFQREAVERLEQDLLIRK